MSDRAMLESSMLLHRDSANYLLALVKNGMMENIFVSAKFIEVADAEPDWVVRRMGQYLEIPGKLLDRDTLRILAHEIKHTVEIYKVDYTKDDPTYRIFSKHIQDDLIAQVIFEEWLFLTSQSWLFSKGRKAFDEMVEMGGTAIYKSREQFDRLVRITLKKKADEPLTPNDKVRAAAKWIAVGGPTFWGLIEPISGALASAAGGYFLLCDP